MEHVLLWSNCQAPIGPHAVPSPHQLVIPRACDLMLADVRQRGWSMFCCGRTAKRPSDHMQFHPPRKLVIPRACDLMLADLRQREWSMFCCGRTAKPPSDHMQFHP